jgi:hypothetical protein
MSQVLGAGHRRSAPSAVSCTSRSRTRSPTSASTPNPDARSGVRRSPPSASAFISVVQSSIEERLDGLVPRGQRALTKLEAESVPPDSSAVAPRRWSLGSQRRGFERKETLQVPTRAAQREGKRARVGRCRGRVSIRPADILNRCPSDRCAGPHAESCERCRVPYTLSWGRSAAFAPITRSRR